MLAGGLMATGVNADEVGLRAAGFVDRILAGANPADLPVEVPTSSELIINLRTAEALGLRLPDSILAAATEVIQ
jgi:putative ABC transport system substrate-binding protein